MMQRNNDEMGHRLLQSSLFLILFAVTLTSRAESPVIAAASNLTLPLDRILERYTAETGIRPRVTYGSSGNLARQIVQGAPYELFIAASRDYVDFLVSQNAIDNQGSRLVRGQLVMFVPEQSILRHYRDLGSITNALKYREYRKIAFANPEHAPYGVAALQALQTAGIWAIEKNRTILAESVSQVLQFALSGNVDLAVMPYSFMQQDKLRNQGDFYPVPDSWHTPVIQYVVLTGKAGAAARNFRDFLYSDSARQIFEMYGYAHADE